MIHGRHYLIGLALGALFFPTFQHLLDYGWKSADYTHAYFIVPISILIVWLKRRDLVEREDWSLLGIVGLILALLVYAFAGRNEFMFLEAGGVILVVAAVAYCRLTPTAFRKMLFPLAYLVFMVPPPGMVIDAVTYPLKVMSAHGGVLLLQAAQFPAQLYGVTLKVGANQLFVSDACSGLRSVVTMLALGAVYIYFQPLSRARQWLLFVLIVPLCLLANSLRIALTGAVAHFKGVAAAEGFFHDTSGVILFIVTALGLIGLTAWLERNDAR